MKLYIKCIENNNELINIGNDNSKNIRLKY